MPAQPQYLGHKNPQINLDQERGTSSDIFSLDKVIYYNIYSVGIINYVIMTVDIASMSLSFSCMYNDFII